MSNNKSMSMRGFVGRGFYYPCRVIWCGLRRNPGGFLWPATFSPVFSVALEPGKPLDAPSRAANTHAVADNLTEFRRSNRLNPERPEHVFDVVRLQNVRLFERALSPQAQHLPARVIGVRKPSQASEAFVTKVRKRRLFHPHRGHYGTTR